MLLSDLQDRYAGMLADSILDEMYLERNALSDRIKSFMKMYTVELSRSRYEKSYNTVQQLESKLKSLSEGHQAEEIKRRLAELKKDMGKWSSLHAESSRDNKYRRLRNLLKDRGFADILEQFDTSLAEEDSFRN